MTDTVNRSEERFSTPEGQILPVTFLPVNSQVPGTGEVVDISRSGAKMNVSAPLRTDQRITIRLSASDADVDEQFEARICWIRLSRGYRWLAGMSFDKTLDTDMLERLATAGYIEQRTSPRTDVLIPATARQETLVGDIDVRITNLSQTGFRVVSVEAMEPGERVLVESEEDDRGVSISAHVRWSNEAEKFSAGCEFVDPDSFKLLKHHMPEETPESPAVRRSRLPGLLGAATLVAVVVGGIAVDYFGMTRLATEAEQMWKSCLASVCSVL